MCESTRNKIMGGFLAMALVLATAAFVADRMWHPRVGPHLPAHVTAPVT